MIRMQFAYIEKLSPVYREIQIYKYNLSSLSPARVATFTVTIKPTTHHPQLPSKVVQIHNTAILSVTNALPCLVQHVWVTQHHQIVQAGYTGKKLNISAELRNLP